MGKVVEKKKKGRPSLLDLQKRKLKQQQEEELWRQQLEQQQLRRSHKFQNPNPSNTPTPVRRSARRNSNNDSGDDEAETDVVDDDGDQSIGKRRKEKKLKLVSKLPDSSVNSGSLNSGSESNPEEDNIVTASHKKRRIEAIEDRSGQRKNDKVGEKQGGGSTNPTSNKQDTKLDADGPSKPLPDKKLLLFILDGLQKKDTYGVFAEPVDPEELPDYHEVIKHPMDFSTLRKKLGSGAYVNLEQFEKDVFLLCSNAMQYNAPDTIYFRQARSIQELATKNFENLRQDSDGNEPEMKIVRRGRPPTKNLKKPVGRPPLERAVSDSPGATLATGGENFNRPNNDLRKASSLEKYASPDPSGRMNYGSRQGEVYISWSAEKYDRADDIFGSMTKGISMKHGKKPILVDENRRNTYNCTSAGVLDSSSALSIFHGQHKHLVPVGLQTEYGYARSLARFAAKLGPVAWMVASKKIQRCLPPGVKFGPGWVGENDISSLESVRPSLSSATPSLIPESNDGKSLENQEGSDSLENKVSPSQSIPTATESCPGPSSLRPGSSFQAHQKSMLQPCVNGVNGTYGFKFPTQMGKLIQTAAKEKPGETKLSGNSNPEKHVDCLSDQKAGSGPPDLNVGFQSPGSPSGRVESMQPELVLQL